MDERKHLIPPDEFRLQSASDFSDGPSVAVYWRNEEEVGEGFLTALSAMGLARVEQFREPAKPPVREVKP
jgi:hypothetical protein